MNEVRFRMISNRIYIGVERATSKLDDQKRIDTHVFVVEDEAPYRRTKRAVRLKLHRKLALHLGFCEYGKPPYKALPVFNPSVFNQKPGQWGHDFDDADV